MLYNPPKKFLLQDTLSLGYNAIVALTDLTTGYSVTVDLTGLSVGDSVLVSLTGSYIQWCNCRSQGSRSKIGSGNVPSHTSMLPIRVWTVVPYAYRQTICIALVDQLLVTLVDLLLYANS